MTLTLTDEVDCSRGDMLVRPGNVPKVSHDFDAMIVWMSAEAMVPGKSYLFKQTTLTTTGQIESLRYRVDVNTLHSAPAPDLQLNEIGRCTITLSQPVFYDAYRRNRSTGAFIIVDRISNVTVGAGMIMDRELPAHAKVAAWELDTALSAGSQTTGVNVVQPAEREARFGQKPTTLLFTGLSGSGKSTIARGVERALFDLGRTSLVMDGEMLRSGLSNDLGYSVTERAENLRRSAHIARMLNDSGLICLIAMVAPEESMRTRAGEVVGAERFIVVHCDAPLEVCQERDPGGKQEQMDYQAPSKADLHLDTSKNSIQESVQQVMDLLRERKVIR